MELWIRSQDKMNLVKINQISINYVNKTQIIANCLPEYYENSGNYYELLGIYKTKERALEVLDEIQEYITPTLSLLDDTLSEKQICQVGNILSMVYEMPEK